MTYRISAHVGGNSLGYIALCASLAATSYAAAALRPGCVRSAAVESSATAPAGWSGG